MLSRWQRIFLLTLFFTAPILLCYVRVSNRVSKVVEEGSRENEQSNTQARTLTNELRKLGRLNGVISTQPTSRYSASR